MGNCVGGTSNDAGPDNRPDIGTPDVVHPPADCDPTAEPKDAPKCVVNDYGVFVDASGSDDSAGTKEAPVKTFDAALKKIGAKPRIYVCEGTYAEHVKISSAVSIYGGFACGSWNYTAAKPKIAPADAGYALEIAKVTGDVVVADLQMEAVAGTEAAPSSIAAFVHGSSVRFLRSNLKAGAGRDGKPGEAGVTGIADKSLDGETPTMMTPAIGALQKTCTCTGAKITGGGKGGDGISVVENRKPATDGSPNLPENPLDHDGKAGASDVSCSPNGSGHNGADAPNAADAPAPANVGTLTEAGWQPTPAAAGADGSPGQGGGGGGGRAGGGGGGGCGSCGGTGGKGGSGGGASIALATVESNVVLAECTLLTQKAGNGGAGAAGGQPGATGGTGGGTGFANGCPGGDGGKGGRGGAGAGGAGGVSAAVVYKGAKPVVESSSVATGDKGQKGAGGKPGQNDGADGLKTDALESQ